MNKKLLVAAVATGAVVLGGFAVTGVAFAAEEAPKPLMQRFAEKLGVSTEEAQEAWETTHAEVSGERLDRAVENELITAEQKGLIIAKQEEVRSQVEEIRANRAENRDAMHELMEETNEWAEENDIPAGMVKGGGVMGNGGRGGMGGMKGAGLGDGECLR